MASTNGSFYKNPIFWILLLLIIFIFVPVGIVMADGEAGYALSFDGVDDYVWLGSTDALMGTGWEDTKSVSLWVKPEGDAVTCFRDDPGQCDTIFGDRPVWWGISRGIINGEDRIWVWNNPTTDGIIFDLIGVKYTSGEWLHIALVHAEGNWTVYKNGKLVDSIESGTTEQPAPLDADPVLQLGAVIKGVNQNWSFQGQIDEVRIYNSALTQTDIRNGLFTELVGDEAGLAAYYRMSDGSGLIVSDDRVLAGGAPVPHPFDGQIRQSEFVSPSVPPPAQWVPSTAFDKPLAHDQVFEMKEDDAGVSMRLTGFGPRPDSLAFEVITNPSLGTLSGTAPDLTFTPNPNANGTESFTYTVRDGSYTSSVGTIELNITAENDAPSANAITVSTPRGTPVIIPVSGSDVDGDVLTYKKVPAPLPEFGRLDRTTFTYTPNPGFVGQDHFSYYAHDGVADSQPALVTIYVGGAPILENAIYLPLLMR